MQEMTMKEVEEVSGGFVLVLFWAFQKTWAMRDPSVNVQLGDTMVP